MSYSVDEWRSMILAGWDKWGTGKPLDLRTVEHLAQEFAKPLMPEIQPYNFDAPWPWIGCGATIYNPLLFTHRSIFMPPYSDAGTWFDGSPRVTALVKEGPKSIVLWRPS